MFSGLGATHPEPIVKFHAGRCETEPRTLVKIDDLLHFQWKDRITQTVDEGMDHTMMHGDATFKRVDTGTESDRVFLLQFTQNKSRRFFFWMQDKDDTQDSDLAKKINDELNPGGEIGRQLRSLRNTPAPGAGGGGAGAGLSLEAMQDVFSSMGMPPAAGAAGAPSPEAGAAGDGAAAAAAATTTVSSDALARALSNMTAPPGSGLCLGDVAGPDDVAAAAIFDDDAAVDRLLPHLPESQRTRAELHSIVRAPQFRQALAQLTRALQSPENYESIMANFGLPSAASTSADPVERFLAAIIAQVAAQRGTDSAMDTGDDAATPPS